MEKEVLEYQAYDLDKDRTIYFENPHGKAAKRLYKQYIDYGFEPEMVVPYDLQYYPLSGRFIVLNSGWCSVSPGARPLLPAGGPAILNFGIRALGGSRVHSLVPLWGHGMAAPMRDGRRPR